MVCRLRSRGRIEQPPDRLGRIKAASLQQRQQGGGKPKGVGPLRWNSWGRLGELPDPWAGGRLDLAGLGAARPIGCFGNVAGPFCFAA